MFSIAENMTPAEYIKDQNDRMSDLIKFLQARAVVKEAILFSGKLFSLAKDKSNYVVFVAECYRELMFFPTPEILTEFENILGDKRYLRWFIDISDIIAEFNRIESSGCIIRKEFAIDCIIHYLYSKINNEVCISAGMFKMYNEQLTNMTAIEMRNIFGKFEYADSVKLDKKASRVTTNKSVEKLVENIGNVEDAKAFMLKLSQGKSEKIFLASLFQYGFIVQKKISKAKFASIVYDLFRLLLKDYHLMTAEEHASQGPPGAYSTYQSKELKRKLFKN